jgi:hypothetical protein
MQMFATILSALFAALGAMAIFWPDAVVGVARSLTTPRGLLAAAAVRVVFGALLIMAASISRAPNLLRVCGALILAAGLATPLIGVELVRSLLDAAGHDGTWLRVIGTIAVALGVSFVWALSPRVHMPRRE